MKMAAQPMSITDWAQVEATQHPGTTGFALWKTQSFGDIRVRMVEYSAGYAADHWCAKGHVILRLDGEIHIELEDGKQLGLKAGQSYQVRRWHSATTLFHDRGATLFIVD